MWHFCHIKKEVTLSGITTKPFLFVMEWEHSVDSILTKWNWMQFDMACSKQFECHVNQKSSNGIDRWATLLKKRFWELIRSLRGGAFYHFAYKQQFKTKGLPIKQTAVVTILWHLFREKLLNKFYVDKWPRIVYHFTLKGATNVVIVANCNYHVLPRET